MDFLILGEDYGYYLPSVYSLNIYTDGNKRLLVSDGKMLNGDDKDWVMSAYNLSNDQMYSLYGNGKAVLSTDNIEAICYADSFLMGRKKAFVHMVALHKHEFGMSDDDTIEDIIKKFIGPKHMSATYKDVIKARLDNSELTWRIMEKMNTRVLKAAGLEHLHAHLHEKFKSIQPTMLT
jgi:hypothetical protein